MNREDIIRMAREAEFWKGTNGLWMCDTNDLERFAALVAAHEAEKWKAENKRDYENWKMAAEKAAECEREACAQVCDALHYEVDAYGAQCATAIRARGQA